MRIKESPYASQVLEEVNFTFGDFFFFKNFIVAEIAEGALFDWESAKAVMKETQRFYGDKKLLHYISNRVANYAVEPTGWKTFSQQNKRLASTSVVLHNGNGKINLMFEKLFHQGTILEYDNLIVAIEAIPDKGFQ